MDTSMSASLHIISKNGTSVFKNYYKYFLFGSICFWWNMIWISLRNHYLHNPTHLIKGPPNGRAVVVIERYRAVPQLFVQCSSNKEKHAAWHPSSRSCCCCTAEVCTLKDTKVSQCWQNKECKQRCQSGYTSMVHEMRVQTTGVSQCQMKALDSSSLMFTICSTQTDIYTTV